MTPLLLLLLVQAQVYTWTDASGVEHFTDDLRIVPRGVKVRTTEGAEISRIDSDVKKPAVVVVAGAPSEPVAPSTSEETWRRLFREARTRVTVLEEDIEADRTKVEEVNGMPINARFTCQTGWWGPPPMLVVNGASSMGVTATGQVLPGVSVTGSVSGTTIIRQPLYVAPCAFNLNPEFERVRERLEKNRRELPRAREELADLERRASFEAVPLHWRR